jgi:hypothetical protein
MICQNLELAMFPSVQQGNICSIESKKNNGGRDLFLKEIDPNKPFQKLVSEVCLMTISMRATKFVQFKNMRNEFHPALEEIRPPLQELFEELGFLVIEPWG